MVEQLPTFPLKPFFVKLYHWIVTPNVADFSLELFCFNNQLVNDVLKRSNNDPPPIYLGLSVVFIR